MPTRITGAKAQGSAAPCKRNNRTLARLYSHVRTPRAIVGVAAHTITYSNNTGMERPLCDVVAELGTCESCIRGWNFDCSDDGGVWVTGRCSAVFQVSNGERTLVKCEPVDSRKVYLCGTTITERTRAWPFGIWNLTAFAGWAAEPPPGVACDVFCQHRRNSYQAMSELVRQAQQPPSWSADDARAYLQSVFREPLAHVPARALIERVEAAEWIYHHPSLPMGQMGCSHNLQRPRRSMCNAKRALRHGLVFCSPVKVRQINWFGFFQPRAESMCLHRHARPRKPAFHTDGSWLEVLRIGTIAVTGSPATVQRFGEGGGHGCWFLAVRGSGIWLNVGRSIRAHSRAELVRTLGFNMSDAIEEGLATTKADEARGRRGTAGWRNPFVEMHPKIRLCDVARARGYDSIQLQEEGCVNPPCYLEVVSCHAGCLKLPNKKCVRPDPSRPPLSPTRALTPSRG